MSYKSKRTIFSMFLFFRYPDWSRFQRNTWLLCCLCVCLPLFSSLPFACCSCSHGDGSRFVYAVNVLSNPRSILTEDHMGSSYLGHSFNLLLLFYGMIRWEAAHIYLIAKMLIATHFLKWKKRKKNDIYVWLSCVVLQAGLLWLCILDYGQKMISRFSKILVLYRCSKKKKKQIKCSVLVCVNFFFKKNRNNE